MTPTRWQLQVYLDVSVFLILSSPLSRLPNTLLLFLEGVKEPPGLTIRVFLKRHFVKNQKAHPIMQQGDTQGEHIQRERLNKQV